MAVQTEMDLHVLVDLTAPAAVCDHRREPLRIALVVDRSGSMRGAKLDATKRSVAYLAGQLTVDDQLAIVAYDDQVLLPYALGPAGVDAVDQARWLASAPVGRPTSPVGGSRASSSCVGAMAASVGWCCSPMGMPTSVAPIRRFSRGWPLRCWGAASRPRPSGSVTAEPALTERFRLVHDHRRGWGRSTRGACR